MYEVLFFFFNDTAPTEIYTLPLHDALPIGVANHKPANTAGPIGWAGVSSNSMIKADAIARIANRPAAVSDFQKGRDRKSTRLNSSHANISYAVFCLKKKQHSHQSRKNTMPT